MSYLKTMPFSEGLQELSGELNSGCLPTETPRSLHLNQIRMAHSVFQPRQFDDLASSETHIECLVKAINDEPSHTLDPVLVWWSGKYWRVIDGHHRILAYKRYFEKIKHDSCIPVSVFEGSLLEAVMESTRTNSKNKLCMSQDDKLNRSWQLTIIGGQLSKSMIAKSCKVGTATVGRMRKKLKELKPIFGAEWHAECLAMTWKEATIYGRVQRIIDDDWEVKLAKQWSRRLAKAFGKKLASQPSVAGKAIQFYSEQLAQDLAITFYYLLSEEDQQRLDDF